MQNTHPYTNYKKPFKSPPNKLRESCLSPKIQNKITRYIVTKPWEGSLREGAAKRSLIAEQKRICKNRLRLPHRTAFWVGYMPKRRHHFHRINTPSCASEQAALAQRAIGRRGSLRGNPLNVLFLRSFFYTSKKSAFPEGKKKKFNIGS